jgi:hypothetical protein
MADRRIEFTLDVTAPFRNQVKIFETLEYYAEHPEVFDVYPEAIEAKVVGKVKSRYEPTAYEKHQAKLKAGGS